MKCTSVTGVGVVREWSRAFVDRNSAAESEPTAAHMDDIKKYRITFVMLQSHCF
jgi:hypothetical protein